MTGSEAQIPADANHGSQGGDIGAAAIPGQRRHGHRDGEHNGNPDGADPARRGGEPAQHVPGIDKDKDRNRDDIGQHRPALRLGVEQPAAGADGIDQNDKYP
jgi:hypothetical protein